MLYSLARNSSLISLFFSHARDFQAITFTHLLFTVAFPLFFGTDMISLFTIVHYEAINKFGLTWFNASKSVDCPLVSLLEVFLCDTPLKLISDHPQ